MRLLGTTLAMIHHFLVKKGFRAAVFDRANLNHQYIRRQKGQRIEVTIGVIRLGVTVHVQAD